MAWRQKTSLSLERALDFYDDNLMDSRGKLARRRSLRTLSVLSAQSLCVVCVHRNQQWDEQKRQQLVVQMLPHVQLENVESYRRDGGVELHRAFSMPDAGEARSCTRS